METSGSDPVKGSGASELSERVTARAPEGMAGYGEVLCYRITGGLDREALSQCVNQLTERHEILRTTFANVDGQRVQIIHPPASITLPFIDLTNDPDPEVRTRRLVKEQSQRVYDLSTGPLLSSMLVQLRSDEHWLVLPAHHIIYDGWSWGIYFRELALLYESGLREDVPPPPEIDRCNMRIMPSGNARFCAQAGPLIRRRLPGGRSFFRGARGPRPAFPESAAADRCRPSRGSHLLRLST